MDSKSRQQKEALGGNKMESTKKDSQISSESPLDNIDPLIASVIQISRRGAPFEPDKDTTTEGDV